MAHKSELIDLMEREEQDALLDMFDDNPKVKPLKLRSSGKDERYFNGTQFIPKRLAIDLMALYNIELYGGSLWIKQGGAHRPNGDDLLASEAQRLLGEETTTNRINEAIQYIRRARVATAPSLDLSHINILNGRLEWKTGTLYPHKSDLFEIYQLPVKYEPDAKCPAFDHYMISTFSNPDTRALVEEVMGWLMIPDVRFEKAIMLIGTGANGKSVLLDIVQALLGHENISNVDLQSLEENRFKAAELVGKLANIFADLDNRALTSSSMFKSLVSGDRLTVERKHQQPFEFRPHARLVFSANQLPHSKDRTFGFYRRWLIIPFENTFDGNKADRHLREKLLRPEELSGIFNRALGGLKRLFEQGHFTEPQSVQDALAEYRRQNDSVASFLEECCRHFPTATINKQTLYNVYKNWCGEQGVKIASQRRLKETLSAIYPDVDEYRTDRGTGPRHWVGITLSEEALQEYTWNG